MLKRMLVWFDKTWNTQIGEEHIDKVDVTELSRLFDVDDVDVDVIFAYPLTKDEQISYLQSFVRHKITTQNYDYFIDCYL